MELHTSFDEELINRYRKRGSPAIFTIYWLEGNTTYPSVDWFDFGAVILGWWLNSAKSLLLGTLREDFPFMDGPYRLIATRKDDCLFIEPKSLDITWTVPITEFVYEIVSASERVRDELGRLKWADDTGLLKGVQDIKALGA